MLKWDKQKEKYFPDRLSNFTAYITAEVMTDDSVEVRRIYEMHANVHGRTYIFEVPASEFATCGWVAQELGARARIMPGMTKKGFFADAIQARSDPESKLYYTRTGWSEIEGQMIYLHNGGYISEEGAVTTAVTTEVTTSSNQSSNHTRAASGVPSDALLQKSEKVSSNHTRAASDVPSDGTVTTVTTFLQKTTHKNILVKLERKLENYCFGENELSITDAVRASLNVLSLARDASTIPLYCVIVRSLLGGNGGAHVTGESGFGKTSFAILLIQHLGRGMDKKHIPASWYDTVATLEKRNSYIKDSTLLIDEYKPEAGQEKEFQAKAGRILRSNANYASRGRQTTGMKTMKEYQPQGYIISTGEDIPQGQSLESRFISVQWADCITTSGTPEAERLKAAQRLADQGVYEFAMKSYIQWLCPRIKEIQAALNARIEDERDLLRFGGHARLNENTADLLIGFKQFLEFAVSVKAVTSKESEDYYQRAIAAFSAIAKDAVRNNQESKPSSKYIRLIRAALASKRAHLIRTNGDYPGDGYGWQRSEDGPATPKGPTIGAMDDDNIWLYPGAAYEIAVVMGKASGDPIITGQTQLTKFLEQNGLLASTDKNVKRPQAAIVKKICGKGERVLHFKMATIYPDDVEPDDGDACNVPETDEKVVTVVTNGYNTTTEAAGDRLLPTSKSSNQVVTVVTDRLPTAAQNGLREPYTPVIEDVISCFVPDSNQIMHMLRVVQTDNHSYAEVVDGRSQRHHLTMPGLEKALLQYPSPHRGGRSA
jgi:hypothetical protein